jgi:hypothetical protein
LRRGWRVDCTPPQGSSHFLIGTVILPPSLRFPPLREGNRWGVVPPVNRGNLKEGSSNATVVRNLSIVDRNLSVDDGDLSIDDRNLSVDDGDLSIDDRNLSIDDRDHTIGKRDRPTR